MDGRYPAARADEPRKSVPEGCLQRAYVDNETLRAALGQFAEHIGRGLDRCRDDDELVIEFNRTPIPNVAQARAAGGGIGYFNVETLRTEKLGEPATHLAGAADDQRAFAGAAGLCSDPGLFLLSQ